MGEPDAGARGCLDVLRGASALTQLYKCQLVDLLRPCRLKEPEDESACILDKLRCLVSDLQEVLSKVDDPGQDSGSNNHHPVSVKEHAHPVAVQNCGPRPQAHKRSKGSGVDVAQRDPATCTPSRPPARSRTPRSPRSSGTAQQQVLTSPELIEVVLGHLVDGEKPRARMRRLGELGMVCKAWRAVVEDEKYWEPLAKAIMPRLEKERGGYPETWLRGVYTYRDYLLGYGKGLLRGPVMRGDGWMADMVLLVDVWDSVDDFSFFSGEVVLGVRHEDDRIFMGARAGAIAPAFSAATRSIGNTHYECISDFFTSVDDHRVRMRYVLHDLRVGRRALLWQSDMSAAGSFIVEENVVYTDDYILTCLSYGPDLLTGFSGFVLERCDDKGNRVEVHDDDDDTPDDQKMWRIACDQGRAPFLLTRGAEIIEVQRFMWAALGY